MTTTVTLNGEPLVKAGTCEVGTFLHVKRPRWRHGDVLVAVFGMQPRFVKLNDVRVDHDTVGSLCVCVVVVGQSTTVRVRSLLRPPAAAAAATLSLRRCRAGPELLAAATVGPRTNTFLRGGAAGVSGALVVIARRKSREVKLSKASWLG